MTVVVRQLIVSSKVIQTQEDDIADNLIASTPNVIATSPAPTNKKRSSKEPGPT